MIDRSTGRRNFGGCPESVNSRGAWRRTVPETLPSRFSSIEAAEADRRRAAGRFLADYPEGVGRGRYVRAGLPRLPFRDGAFDVVVCAHLLFLHAARHDLAWHAAACRELLRVAGTQVRIHPLCGLDGRPSPLLAGLLEQLERVGIEARAFPVEAPFFAGADTTLVLKRK